VRNWRVLTAIAAVVLAALAGVLVWKYTENAKDDAKKPYTFETVLVAKSNIAPGTAFASAFDSEQIAREDRVRNDLPPTVIPGTANSEELKNTYGELVASHDIAQGSTIVASDFVGEGAIQSSLSGGLENDNKTKKEHLEAISLTFDDEHAVGGFLTPGDSVNVLLNMKEDAGKVCTAAQGFAPMFTSYLLPNMKVLAVGSTTASPQTSTAAASSGTTPTTNASTARSRSLITFEVTSRQAEQLIQAQACAQATNGTLYLTLNPTSFKAGDFKDPGEVVEALNLFDKPLPLEEQTAKNPPSRPGQ
jgi:Flp pilus assembly protein CpaB